MKTVCLTIAVLVLIVLSVPTPTADAAAATIINLEVPCHFFDGDGVWTSAFGDCNFRIVFAANDQIGVVIAKCQITPASDGDAAHFDFTNTGIPCTVGTVASTQDWQETVSSTGVVNMYCIFH